MRNDYLITYVIRSFETMAGATASLRRSSTHDIPLSFRPRLSRSRSARQAFVAAVALLFLASSASTQAQNYNPNNYDTGKIIQEMRHPHNDLSLVVAHRGLHATLGEASYVPENSLAAVGAAAQAGIEIVEVDIKVTQDGIPILSHDTSWGREWCGLPNLGNGNNRFNPFLAPGNPVNDSVNPLVSATSLGNTKSVLGTTYLRPLNVLLANPTGCSLGTVVEYPPTLQDVLNFMTQNKIAMVLALDIKDDATAQICWNLIKTQKDFRGNPYSQSVVFKMPGRVYNSAAAFHSSFGSDYTSILFWPFYGTADISPQTASIDDSYGTDEPLIAGFGSEANIIASIRSFQQSSVQLVGTEVNLKQPGGILTQVLAAAKVSNSVAAASVGSFNPEAEYIDPSDTTKTAEFFNAAGPTSAHCCYKLSDLFYNGAGNGQPSDTADDRGDLNFLIANGDDVITTDSGPSVASTLAGLGKRNISYLQASSGTQRSIVPLRVMPIGDSITEGAYGTTGNGYRYPLQQDTQNMGQTIEFVGDRTDGTMTNPQNEGFSGQVISYIASQAIPSAASWRPNVALIEAGTNDVNGNDDVADAPSRLDSMISGLFTSAPDATMLVAGIPPSSDPNYNTNLQAFNESVQALVATRQNAGQHVQYVDMSNLDPNADKANTLHPNDAGYQIMGNNFAAAIENVMNMGWVTPPVAITRTIGGSSHGNGTPQPPLGPAAWQPLGAIASGIGTPTGSITIMADLNGDGRADYLSVEPNGSVYGYLNGGANPAGGWVWLPQPEITSGGGALGSQIRFADINGDGRADVLAVAQDGSVTGYLNGGANPDGSGWVWLPQPSIHPGADGPGDEIQFADVNGDGKADYLIIDRTTGAVTMELNLGNGNWGPATVVASGTGAPAGSKVMFADINGDGFADYLTVSSIDGTVSAYMNGGVKVDGTLNLYSVGHVAPGLGAPSLDLAVLFADLDGDGVADYFAVNRNTGGLNVSLTKGLDTAAVSSWIPLGQIASGEGGPNIQIQFADIDGDGRADYIAINTLNGSATGYLNGGQKQGGWIWYPEPNLAAGANAAPGSVYRFADVNGDGKADYLVVGLYNAVSAQLSIGQGADGWIWSSPSQIYGGSSSWANVGSAANVYFADMNGDGYADFLVINDSGNVEGLINDQLPDAFDRVGPQPVYNFAYNPTTNSTALLANINLGDKRADYLSIGNGGSVTAFLNTGVTDGGVNYNPVGQIAAGEAPAGSSVIMADINGDGRADYLVVSNTTGAVTAWLNNGPY